MGIARIKRLILGQPMESRSSGVKKISKRRALALLSADVFSSVAYATEEMLLALVAFSVAAVTWSVPVAVAIVCLLIVLVMSYRQTVEAYPGGGGGYWVAKENLGPFFGLIAGAALMIGYVMTVAVSISAAVAALASAYPSIGEYRTLVSAVLISGITYINLRGALIGTSILALVVYLFIAAMFFLVFFVLFENSTSPMPTSPWMPLDVLPVVPVFLILRAFASGCVALTGLENVSHSVSELTHPVQRNAKVILTWMAIILAFLFIGVTWTVQTLELYPVRSETLISQLARHTFGEGVVYYLIQIATFSVLVVAAHACYMGFPKLSAFLADDRYMPRQLAIQGDKLVFSNSILGLSVLSFGMIWLFSADIHRILPLYAFGVFLGFTLSQVGMVRFHFRGRSPGWLFRLLVNFFGGIVTFGVTWVIGVTRFEDGAWVVILSIPVLMILFWRIRKHYLDVGKELTLQDVEAPRHLSKVKHTVIVPVSGVHRGVVDALRYGISISDDVRACYVEINPKKTENMKELWKKWGHDVPFVVLRSPYRSVIEPILEYIDDVERASGGEFITVIIPEFVTKKWHHRLLHNQTAVLIRSALGNRPGKIVTSVRYHLKST